MKTIKVNLLRKGERTRETFISKEDILELINELDDLRTVEQLKLELKARIKG